MKLTTTQLNQQFQQAILEVLIDGIRKRFRDKIEIERHKWMWGLQWCGARDLKKQLANFENAIQGARVSFESSQPTTSFEASLVRHGNIAFDIVTSACSNNSGCPQANLESLIKKVIEATKDESDPIQKVQDISDNKFQSLVLSCREICNLAREKESITEIQQPSFSEKIKLSLVGLYSIKNIEEMDNEAICSQIPWGFKIPSERQTVRRLLLALEKPRITHEDKVDAFRRIDRLSALTKFKNNQKPFEDMKRAFMRQCYFENIEVVKEEDVVTVSQSSSADSLLEGAQVVTDLVPQGERKVGSGPSLFDHGKCVNYPKTKRACAEKSFDYVVKIICEFEPGKEINDELKKNLIEKFETPLEVYGDPDDPDDYLKSQAMILMNILFWYGENEYFSKKLTSQEKNAVNNLRRGLMNYIDPSIPKDYDRTIKFSPSDNSVSIALNNIIKQLFSGGVESCLGDALMYRQVSATCSK